jgi:hypothetical protein
MFIVVVGLELKGQDAPNGVDDEELGVGGVVDGGVGPNVAVEVAHQGNVEFRDRPSRPPPESY